MAPSLPSRDPALLPLSRGHERMLSLIHRCEKGEARRGELLPFWRNEFEPHLRAEEELFFPLSRPDHVARVRADHAWLRMAHAALLAQSDDSTELFSAISGVLVAHFRFEEQVWFESLQEHAAADRLAVLEQGIRSYGF